MSFSVRTKEPQFTLRFGPYSPIRRNLTGHEQSIHFTEGNRAERSNKTEFGGMRYSPTDSPCIHPKGMHRLEEI
jgi:hypothetical protein